MSATLPLVVAVPLLTAAVLAATGAFLPRRVTEIAATLAAAATTALNFVVLHDASNHDSIHFFGGWRPSHGHLLGVAFTANALDAAIGCLVGVIAVAALTFSIRYFEEAGHLFQVLMLVFLGGMNGFAVTGDLFNLFVFFELMTVAGYALCGYRIERSSVMQGTLNFAVLNTIGAFFVLIGIALIYARSGALNLAQIAAELDGKPADTTLGVAFASLCVGFLIKAGAVPFHFWLSDAYAIAAAPAGALFAGVMSDLGYHAIARIYWTCFSGGLAPHLAGMRTLLVGIGLVTTVVGAVMCYLQADVKRQLAMLVVSHGGASLVGVGLLSADGMAASTYYVIADGLVKAALFLTFGLVVARLGASDELVLHGRGRRQARSVAVLLFVAVAGVATVPGFGTWRAVSLLASAARQQSMTWVVFVLAISIGVTAGTMLRAAARIFLGWGASRDAVLAQQPDADLGGESEERVGPSRWIALAPAGLLVVAVVVGLVPMLAGHALTAGRSFVDVHGYVDEVLHGIIPPASPVPHVGVTAIGWIVSATAIATALLTAAFGLRGRRLSTARPPVVVRALHAVHSGAVGDYVLWLSGGAAALCAAMIALVR